MTSLAEVSDALTHVSEFLDLPDLFNFSFACRTTSLCSRRAFRNRPWSGDYRINIGHGTWEFHIRDGKLKGNSELICGPHRSKKFIFRDGLRDGPFEIIDGSMKTIGTFSAGLLHGPYERVERCGSIITSQIDCGFDHGKLHGTYRSLLRGRTIYLHKYHLGERVIPMPALVHKTEREKKDAKK